MNFGLALRKPGESDLGLASRLWMANAQSWLLDSLPINERVAQAISAMPSNEFADIDPSKSGLDKIRAWERIKLDDRPFAQFPKKIRWTDHYRQCASCAVNGYHSTYFNSLWIDECPVHHEPLLDNCPGCNKRWPNINAVQKRTCNTCGIRKKSDAAENFQMFVSNAYQPIEELDLFFSVPVSLATARSGDPKFRSRRCDELAQTLNYPSVVSEHCFSDYSDWLDSLPLSDILQPLKKHTFKVDKKKRPSWNGDINESMTNKMAGIRQELLDLLFNHPEMSKGRSWFRYVCKESPEQVKQTGYTRGYALPDRFYSACVDYFDRLVSFENGFEKHANNKAYEDPCVFTHLEIREGGVLCNIPQELQLHLYRLDLIVAIKQIQFAMLFRNGCEWLPSRDDSRNTYCQVTTLNYANGYTFVVDGGKIHLYYPIEYEQIFEDVFVEWLKSHNSASQQ